jgi:HAD superfamily hydrolase (TIGR01549 family)
MGTLRKWPHFDYDGETTMRSPGMRIGALCLDLDGTLLDGSGLSDAIARVCEDVAAAEGDLDASRVLEANGEVWRDFWPRIEGKWTLGGLAGAEVKAEAWRRTLRACGCTDESLVRLAVESASRHERLSMRLFDDARTMLDLLPSGLPLALITNGASDTQREKLQVLGLGERFQVVVVSAEIGFMKPHSNAFRVAIDRLGVPAGEAWHVGDNLTSDVGGANNAGLTSVWINRLGALRHAEQPQPCHELGSLLELLPLLKGAC